MFTRDVVFYGESAKKINALKESGIFERILDVYMAAGLIGLVINKKKMPEKENFTAKINSAQLNGEISRLKYFSSLVMLVEESDKIDDQIEQRNILNKAFCDWSTEKDVSDSDKYKLFYEYSLGGIDFLYDKIIGTSTDEKRYYREFRKLVKSINKLDIGTNDDRLILGLI